eukprot:7577506-Pyramimonas_sp.AAC.1
MVAARPSRCLFPVVEVTVGDLGADPSPAHESIYALVLVDRQSPRTICKGGGFAPPPREQRHRYRAAS